MKKTSIFKKVLSALLCVCLFVTSVSVGITVLKQDVSAETVGESQTVKRKELVFDSNGYDNATIVENITDPRTGTWYKIAGDLSPIAEPGNSDNKVLWYRQNYYGLAGIVLGHDYSTNTVSSTIDVEPGKSYAVSFDYKILSETTRSAIQIGMAIDEEETYAFGTSDHGQNEFYSLVTRYQVEIEIGANSTNATMTDWATHTAYVTIPEDAEYAGQNLMLYMRTGNQVNSTDSEGNTVLGGVLFDNIKVYSLAEYEETVLSYNDYETATAYDNTDNTVEVWDVANAACKYSGNIFAAQDPDGSGNIAMRYHNYLRAFGAITLGDAYQDHNPADHIKAEAGKTYKITFDWKVNNTAKRKLTMGVALGTIGNGSEWIADEATMLGSSPIKKELVTIAANGGEEYKEWQTETVYFTVPDDYDNTTYNRLMLYASGGGTTSGTVAEGNVVPSISMYFDNITVAEVTDINVYDKFVDTQLSYNDYETVHSDYIYSLESDGSDPWASKYHKNYGDFFAFQDPDNQDNTVIRYKHYRTDTSALTLGVSLNNDSDATSGYVVAKKGIAYKVEYKWKTSGTAYREAKIGLAIGKQNTEDTLFDATCLGQTKVQTVIGQGEKGPSDWTEETAYITVDDTLDTSVYDRLMIYAQGGGTFSAGSDYALYLDDITVTELAGANVSYVIDGTENADISGFVADGCAYNHELKNDEGTEIKWYFDAEYTKPVTFDANGYYDVDDEFADLTIYGKWSPVVTYYINQHVIGSTIPYDGIKKSYDSESASLDNLSNVVSGTAAEGTLSEDLQFEGWYSLSYVDSAYSYDKKITTVAEAIEAGGVYAKYKRINNETIEYDIAGPEDSTATNSYYSSLMAGADASYGDMYSTEYLDEQWVIKFAMENTTTGKKSLLIANPNTDNYAGATAITNSTYANLELGTAYKVTLKYRVDVTPSVPMEIELWSAPITQYWNDTYKHYFMEIATVNEATDGWQEATAYFTAEALRGIWNDPAATVKNTGVFSDALSIVTFGAGEIYYDDITVTALSEEAYKKVVAEDKLSFAISNAAANGVVSFDDTVRFTYDKTSEKIDIQSDNYQPRINDFMVNNTKVYESTGTTGTTFKANYNDSEDTSVSVNLYNRLDCDMTSNFSVVAAKGADEDSMRFILRTYSDYEDYGYFGNVAYSIVDRGVLVALTDYAGYEINADNITATTEGVQKISCVNGLYNQTDIFYDYTVSVDGITDLFKNHNIGVRGYMTLTNGNTEFTVFSDNVITNSLIAADGGSEGSSTAYETQVDPELEILETGITSVTLALYDDGDEDINEYGVTWITDAKHSDNVIQVIEEGGNFNEPSLKFEDITVTEYTTHVLQEGYDYLNFKAAWGIKGDGSGNLWEETSMESIRYSNKGVISGLEPATTYKYRVGYKDADGKWNYSYTGTITTPEANDTDGFKFVYMADSQQDFSSITSTLTKTLGAMYARSKDVEFIAHGGDIINYNSYEEQWTRLLDANKRYFMSIPFMPTAGNHEYNMSATIGYDFYNHFNVYAPESADGTAEKEVNGYSGTYYSYDYKNVHFVVLNTNDGYSTGVSDSSMPFKLTDAQVQWLNEDLQTANADSNIDFTIVYMHCGLYMTGTFGSNSTLNSGMGGLPQNIQSLTLRTQLREIFYNNGVDLVMNGHDHVYSVTEVLDANGNPVSDTSENGGVVYMTAAVAGNNAPGSPLIDDGDQYPIDAANGVYASVIGKKSYCWTELDVTEDKIIVTNYTANTGTAEADKVIHKFEITKNNVGNNIPEDGTVIGTTTE